MAGMHPVLILQLVILTALANGTPVAVKKLMGERFAWPVDGGRRFLDGRPWFGASKTWRGVLLAILVTAAAAPFIGQSVGVGLLVAATAMAGDLLSSFLKRRLDLPSSARATGLDQVPESLLPLIVVRPLVGLSLVDMFIAVLLFFVGEIAISRWLFRIGLRDRPY